MREEQAARTKERIVDAAGGLFEANGYGRTSVRMIAEEAGVAVDTVYAVFGSKVRVLTAVVDARLGGRDVANVTESPQARAVRDELDPRRQVRLFAQTIAAFSAGARPMFEILRTASAVEADAGPIYAEMEEYRLRNMRTFVGWLAARGKLRMSVEKAAETVWAIASPDVARLLCDVRGWSEQEHADWLDETLSRVLLASD